METERRASAAVALCVDLSFSMISEGRWGPMKQTALALSHLVATRFPQDALQIIGFGRQALPLSQRELAAVEPDLVQGTNLQHALRLAGRHLRRHSGRRAGGAGGHRRRADRAPGPGRRAGGVPLAAAAGRRRGDASPRSTS